MGKYQAEAQSDGSIKLQKSYEKLADENREKAIDLDYITKEEIISAIKKIAKKINVEVHFTYDNLKNDIIKK